MTLFFFRSSRHSSPSRSPSKSAAEGLLKEGVPSEEGARLHVIYSGLKGLKVVRRKGTIKRGFNDFLDGCKWSKHDRLREAVSGMTEESAFDILEENGWRIDEAIRKGKDEQLQVRTDLDFAKDSGFGVWGWRNWGGS